MQRYNFSPSQLLASVYPSYSWLPWRFGKCPQNFWGEISNQRKFLDWASKELNIKEMADWYNISHKVILKLK